MMLLSSPLQIINHIKLHLLLLTLCDLKLSVLCLNRLVHVPEHLHQYLQCVQPQTVLLLGRYYALMLALLELALRDLRQRVDCPLEDVLLLHVTVIVDKDLEEVLGVLGQLVEDLEDQVLVVVDRVARVEDAQEDLLKEDNNFLLEVLPEVQEETVEDGKGEREDGLFIRYTVLQKAITEGVLDN